MSKQEKKSCIDSVAPHTIKKCELIEKYVKEWAPKILNLPNANGIVFIDCFSNCGLYYNELGLRVDGTPVRVARYIYSLLKDSRYQGKNAYLLFNDISPDKISMLKQQLQCYQLANLVIEFSVQDADIFLKNLDLRRFSGYNTLLFYDPYEATIDWDAVSPFLRRWGEVILNHMVSDTKRGLGQTKKSETKKKYEQTYQSDFDTLTTDQKTLEEKINSILKDKAKGGLIASFPFYNRTNNKLYSLILYTQSTAGFQLYKKVAWKTFEGKSSGIEPHKAQIEGQLIFGSGGEYEQVIETDERALTVDDIAKYIQGIFGTRGDISFGDVYAELEKHPNFPSDGFRKEIKESLRRLFGVTTNKSAFHFGSNNEQIKN